MSNQNPNKFEVDTWETIYTIENPIASPKLIESIGGTAMGEYQLATESKEHDYYDVEEALRQHVIGQPEAVDSIISTLKRDKLRDPEKPIASMMFLGPTGVGKTEMSKELARQLHPMEDINNYFLKVDCSDFQHSHDVKALTGAPPSYVGYGKPTKFESGTLDMPQNIVLFDEIEKADPALYKVMLQIMEEGELDLQKGGKVSFKDSIIIMTSNLGADKMMQLLEPKTTGFQRENVNQELPTKDQLKTSALTASKDHFPPEFINRLDDQVVFNPLNDQDLGEVLNRHLDRSNQRYAASSQVELELTPELHRSIISGCDDRRQMGARPILRAYDQRVESKVSELISSKDVPQRSKVLVDLNKDGEVDVYHKPDENLYWQYEELRLEQMEILSRAIEVASSPIKSSPEPEPTPKPKPKPAPKQKPKPKPAPAAEPKEAKDAPRLSLNGDGRLVWPL